MSSSAVPIDVGERIRNPTQTMGLLWKWCRSHYDRAQSEDYTDYYLRHTKRGRDPRSLVGPLETWEQTLEWQTTQLFDRIGVQPEDTVLDVGCGVFRAGLPLLEYLEPGNYYGCDISERALNAGRARLEQNGIDPERAGRIWRNDGLSFRDIREVDLLWSQSVLTHLPREQAKEFLGSLDRVLASDGEAWITYYRGTNYKPKFQTVNFRYTVDELDEMAGPRTVEDVDPAGHPNGLDLLVVR
ncbi:class I SAM-dependent methyltransferase [Haloarchaeobius sp. TZWSO28]|uniref:class I SAM-dependent methyltransferase n=1 Tax=Haloarchaeobius sp. TZWSO28 TaxID=3446119 RepID=UPI003EBEF49D